MNTKKRNSLLTAAAMAAISTTLCASAWAQTPAMDDPNGINSQKAAETFAEAMDVSARMQLTGPAAEVVKLNREIRKKELEAAKENVDADLLEARTRKQKALQDYQASLWTPTQTTTDVNALPKLPETKNAEATTDETTEETEKAEAEEEKEEVFQHSALPSVRVISGSNGKYTAVISMQSGAPATISEGDKVGTWTVQKISTDGVTVIGGDKEKTVETLSFQRM